MALPSPYQLPLFAFERRCPTCKQYKALDAFYRDRHAPDGLKGSCKDCSAAYQRAWREREHDSVIAKSRAKYYADVEASRAYQRAWRAANPDKARGAVQRWYRNHRDKTAAAHAAYRAANRPKLRA